MIEQIKQLFLEAWNEAKEQGFGVRGFIKVERVQSLYDPKKIYWIVYIDKEKLYAVCNRMQWDIREVLTALKKLFIEGYGFDLAFATITLEPL